MISPNIDHRTPPEGSNSTSDSWLSDHKTAPRETGGAPHYTTTNSTMPAKKSAEKKTQKYIEVAGLKLRPFGVAELILCGKLGIDLADDGTDSEIDDFGQIEQIARLLWLQSTPLREVRRAVKAGKWEEAVEEFTDRLDLARLVEYGEAIEAQLGSVGG